MGDLFFISHSSRDSVLVEKVVSHLEAGGVRCWSSGRDIPPGSDWAETIYNAISSSRALILLFSEHSNASWQVRNELDIATNLKIPIIPVRLDDTEVCKGIRYFTSSHQWLDESGSGGERLLADILSAALAVHTGGAGPEAVTGGPKGRSRSWRWIAAGSALAMAIPATVGIMMDRGGGGSPEMINLIVGGTDSWDYATDVIVCENGRFFVSGTWDSGFWSEAWVARFDEKGRLLWSWSDSLAGECEPRLVSTPDGGVIVGYGQYADFDHTGFWVEASRLDSMGSQAWNRLLRIEWPGAVQPVFGSIEQGPDGLVRLAFTLRSRNRGAGDAIHLVELHPGDGAMTWDTIPGCHESYAYLTDSSAGIFNVYQESESRAVGVSYTPAGGSETRKIVIGDNRTQAGCATLTDEGDLVLCLTSNSYVAGNGDLVVMVISPGLVRNWESTFGGDLWDGASAVTVLQDGSILIGGSTMSFGDGSPDGWILLLDDEGRLRNETVIDLGGSEYVSSLAALPGGGFLAAGSVSRDGDPDAWIIELSEDGSFSEEIRTGIDIFREDWQRGFLDQGIWLMGSNRNYSPTILTDSLTGDAAVDLNCVPLVSRAGFRASPGVRLSAEVYVNDAPSVSGSNCVSIGLTSEDADSYLRDPASTPSADLQWIYTGGAGDLSRSIRARCFLGDSLFEKVADDSGWIGYAAGIPLAIELCSGTIRFHVGGRLFMEAPLEGNLPDSVRIVLNGNSDSSPHRLDDIRLFHGRW